MSIRRPTTTQAAADLEESLAALSVLEENLKKTDSITEKMATLLSTVFDSRLGKLEENIKPMYNKTRNLTQITQNIDATIAAMDNVKKNFDTVPREEAIIRAGPKQNIQEYLSSITRLQGSLNTLTRSHIRSADNVQSQMSQLVKLGVKQLDDVFRKTLTTHSTPIDPKSFLAQDLPFPEIPPQAAQLLQTLTKFFASIPGLDTQYETIYADVRGTYLSNSLSELSAAVISSAQGRPGQTFSLGSLLKATISLLETEFETTMKIIPERPDDVLIQTSLPQLSQLSRTFKALNTSIRTSPSQNLPLTLSILEDVAVVQDSISRSQLPRETVDGLKRECTGLEREAKGVGAVGVADIMEDIKRRGQGVLTLPADASVIDLTTDTMTKLTNLMQYSRSLTQLLISLPSSSWNLSSQPSLGPLPHEQDARTVLGRWMLDVIDTLTVILDQKSRTLLRPRMASNLFILNNLSEVEKRVRKSSLMASVLGNIAGAEKEREGASKRGSRGSSGSSGGTVFSMPKSFEKARRAGLDGYLDGYKDAASHLLDVTYIKGNSNRTSGTLTAKEREAVKERFRNFNTEFEEIVRINRILSVPDADVRGLVIGEVKRVVIPLYTRFYDKHANENFTKNLGKYIRWDKNQLDGVISRFFEGRLGQV